MQGIRKIFILTVTVLAVFSVPAQSSPVGKSAQEEIKGWSFAAFPIVALDPDRGFKYGAFGNLYDFGDGGWYPVPRSQLYFEGALYAKDGNAAASQRFILSYDNRVLIPGVRLCASLQLLNDPFCDFYGYNGYESYYDSALPNAYYRINRLMPYGKLDFLGDVGKVKNLHWMAGYNFKYFSIGAVGSDALPACPEGTSLFERYCAAGLVPSDQKDGGISSSLRAGLRYDSRDNEAMPSHGLMAEASLEYAPKFLGCSSTYAKYTVSIRHFVPIVRKTLIWALNLNNQGFFGEPAWYVLPFDNRMGWGYDNDAFGGYFNIRGLMRNRIQGRNVFYFNNELRWFFGDLHLLGYDINFCVSGFVDGGKVLLDYVGMPISDTVISNFLTGKDKMHLTSGLGLRLILNKNCILTAESAFPVGRNRFQDNRDACVFYFTTDFTF